MNLSYSLVTIFLVLIFAIYLIQSSSFHENYVAEKGAFGITIMPKELKRVFKNVPCSDKKS